MNQFKGILYGIATSITFGLIPLFTLPLMQRGMQFSSILFYRFLFATIALGIMLKVRKQTFSIERADLPVLILLGLLYTGSALFLLMGYSYMGAGVATTIHFTYPVFVTLLMLLFFHERTPLLTWLAIVLAIFGVAKLSLHGSELTLSPTGIGIVLLSAVCYASYIVIVNRSRVRDMNSRKLAFYVFIVSSLLFLLNAVCAPEGLQPPTTGGMSSVVLIALLAVVPTVVSNITLVQAVHRIGGTMTSILGALEPVTAVSIGVLIFQEPFTLSEATGVGLIILAVIFIILNKQVQGKLSTVLRRIRPRHS